MICKKSHLKLSCLLFVSLCSPIQAETSWTEEIARGLCYGYFGMETTKIRYHHSSISKNLPIFIVGSMMMDEFVLDKYFTESDRNLLGKERFSINTMSILYGFAAGKVGEVIDMLTEKEDGFSTKSHIFRDTFGFIEGITGSLHAKYRLKEKLKNKQDDK